MNPATWLEVKRVVRFGETDAAGVMHFHQLLRWCHEAWEDSLRLYGLSSDEVFPGGRNQTNWPRVALPVIHCEADFRRPIYRGDELILKLKPERLHPGCFQVTTTFLCHKEEVATGVMRHLAINADSRQRCDLAQEIDRWLEASTLGIVEST